MPAARRVVLTRTPADNARLRAALAGIDAEIVEYPCIAIETVPLQDGIRQRLLDGYYDSVFFVSRNAVEHLPRIAPIPAHVVALGGSTAEAIRSCGWGSAIQPSEARLDVAVREVDRLFPQASRVLYVRGELGQDMLPEALRARGSEVDVAVIYATRNAAEAPLPSDERPTLVVFASPSAVRHFVSHNATRGSACAIGETTAQAAGEVGFRVHVAPASTQEALVEGVRSWAKSA